MNTLEDATLTATATTTPPTMGHDHETDDMTRACELTPDGYRIEGRGVAGTIASTGGTVADECTRLRAQASELELVARGEDAFFTLGKTVLA